MRLKNTCCITHSPPFEGAGHGTSVALYPKVAAFLPTSRGEVVIRMSRAKQIGVFKNNVENVVGHAHHVPTQKIAQQCAQAHHQYFQILICFQIALQCIPIRLISCPAQNHFAKPLG